MTAETMSIPETTPPNLRPSIYLCMRGSARPGPHVAGEAPPRGRTGYFLPHQAGPLRIEGPAVDVKLHADAVVPGVQTVLKVQQVGLVQGFAVQFDAESGK